MTVEIEGRIPDNFPADSDWCDLLDDHFASEGFQHLKQFVETQRDEHEIFPPAKNVFNAFGYSSFADTKVVILGQDPYHGPGQAHGLSFSVLPGIKLPPSLKNIFKELNSDLGIENESGELTAWAKQGVLLLNTVLTVQSGKPNSHRRKGWESFTDLVIEKLGQRNEPMVFILWGKPAASKKPLIDDHHHTIESPHPSPLSAHRGFLGSRPFSQANNFLKSVGSSPIHWQI